MPVNWDEFTPVETPPPKGVDWSRFKPATTLLSEDEVRKVTGAAASSQELAVRNAQAAKQLEVSVPVEETLRESDASLWERFRDTDFARKLLGPTELEQQAIAEGTLAGPPGGDLGLANIAITSPFPFLPGPNTAAGKALLGYFVHQYAEHQPQRIEEIKQLFKDGDIAGGMREVVFNLAETTMAAGGVAGLHQGVTARYQSPSRKAAQMLDDLVATTDLTTSKPPTPIVRWENFSPVKPVEKPLNPGGSVKDLPPDLKAIESANAAKQREIFEEWKRSQTKEQGTTPAQSTSATSPVPSGEQTAPVSPAVFVDASGAPIEFFHGTKQRFDVKDFNTETGAYFSQDKKYAERPTMGGGGGNIISAFLKMENPLIFEKGGRLPSTTSFYKLTPKKIQEYKSKGYDSLQLRHPNGQIIEAVVFDKNQIIPRNELTRNRGGASKSHPRSLDDPKEAGRENERGIRSGVSDNPKGVSASESPFTRGLNRAARVTEPPTPQPESAVAALPKPTVTQEVTESMASPAPPIRQPPPSGAPGTAMLFDAELPVTLPRTAPGSVSVPQIMQSFENVLHVAGSLSGDIRTGRIAQKARGIWKPHEEVARLVSADNIPTATHEIAHGLQQMVYGTARAAGLKFLSPDIRRELVGLGKALYGGKKPVAGYSGEGFAEYMRYWLTTDDAAKVAPRMTEFFEKTFLPKHPEISKALASSRKMVDTWRFQGSEERARRQMVREPGSFKRVVDALRQFVGYKAQMESGAPLEAASKIAERKLGRKLPPSADPYSLFSFKRGSAGATVERMVMNNMLDIWGNPVGPPLKDAFSLAKGQREKLLLHLFSKEAIERWNQGKNPGLQLEDAKYIHSLTSSPEMNLAAQKYKDWWNGVLDYVVQADPAMAPEVARMKAANQFYAPLARMIDPARMRSAAARANSNPFMRMTGSGLPVKDIFDQTFLNAARLINRANRSMVARSVINLSRIKGMGHIVEEVPRSKVEKAVNIESIRKQLEDMGVDTTSIPADEILQYYSLADLPKGSDPIIAFKTPSGETKWYHVEPQIFDSLEKLQTFSLKNAFPGIPYLGTMLDLVAGAPSRAFRLGVTGLRPTFSLFTNPTRDLQTLLVQTTSNPAKAAAMYPAALAEAIGGGKYKDAFYDLGAHLGQPLGTDIGHTKRISKELFHGRVMRVVRNPIDHLRELLSITESAPRIAEIKAVADDIGWKPGQPMTPDQAVQLALAGKRVTVDFSAAGDVGRVLNQAIPFYNPALQGTRAFARALKNHPARATLTALALFTAPALYNWWKNKDEEWYRSLPWRERYLYTNVDDGKNVWQIPRPFEWGNAFQVIPEAILDSWYAQDPQAVKTAMGHIFETVNPADYPVVAKIAKEQWQNRIAFWDRPIVPRGETDLPPSEQVGPYTSKVAIAINKAFPALAPRRIDAAVAGYFGGLGTDVVQALGVNNQTDREWEASDFPVFGRVFRRGGHFNAQNQHIMDFWDTYLPSKARVDGFNYGAAQVKNGLRRPETLKEPSLYDLGTAQIGEDAAKAIRLLTQLASRTREGAARAALYREAGQMAEQATTAMKNLAKQEAQ